MPETAHEARHPQRERVLRDASAAASLRRSNLARDESAVLFRGDVDRWRKLTAANERERKRLINRIERAERLRVRLMYTPLERRDRDEEHAAALSDCCFADDVHARDRVRPWEESL